MKRKIALVGILISFILLPFTSPVSEEDTGVTAVTVHTQVTEAHIIRGIMPEVAGARTKAVIIKIRRRMTITGKENREHIALLIAT